ncbi:hypothetical protein GCM10011611_50130 [Aliidongia dinghuensis]|uniref:Dystroglycan-type cadherin-like domain-containing protein n=1 Tax=Aliidongia dinghuensis TaxID=1867774 RepID=A0A8J2YYB5_9PROT|nr:DUF4347 domain-containing protein [Aliidongia dinghuensis]GGF37632.1 hypothetical protein GCM10011611_50130 [Aliidongia dinghuensis]
MKLVLEARHLFDGSVHAVAKHAADTADHDHSHPADHTHSTESHSDPAPIAPAAVSYADVPALAPNPTANEILFVDPRVANWQSLASSVKSNVQVVVIDPTKDGIDQVTAALQGRSALTSIQFLTYGQPGQLELGSGTVTTASLSSHAAEVASWGDHLAPGADIEFWGCNVAQGSVGQGFVDTVHTLTGATVGASTDATGAAALGGNWVLEDTTGPLHRAVFSDAAMAAYSNVLDSAVPTVTITAGTGTTTSGTTGDVLLGDTFTETVSFTNTNAGTKAGFGPIIELFVPTVTATDPETATLSSATYLGQVVTEHALTLTTDPANHGTQIGAYDPFVLDTSGKATWIAAPSGFKAGDTMFDLVLPFGSFTVGQPTADITLNFTLDPTSALTSHTTGTKTGSTLNIAATGVFEFGNDALNNPSTDPSIVGATVSSSTTVSLVNIQGTTDLHESETATGPNNPFNYVVTITPAPVVAASDPINTGTLTFRLPGDVDYSGGTVLVLDHNGNPIAGDHGTFTGTLGTPGGTITVSLGSLTQVATIKIPVYVPEKDSSGATILTAGNGYQRTIQTSPNFHFAGSWEPPASNYARADGTEAVTEDGATPVTFTAKALAIQVVDSNGGSAAGNGTLVLPPNAGSDVTETINFQVSDYVSLSNLVIKDVLGDGFALDPSFTPTLTVNNPTSANGTFTGDFGAATGQTTDTISSQTVALAGTGANWNYLRTDTSGNGTTAINFMIGALMAESLAGHLSAATSGTITFKVKTLDQYTETNSGGSLREKDFATNTIDSTGTSAAVTATSDSGTTTDGSSLTDVVPNNALALSIVDVNGVSSNGSGGIKAGDTVTYELTYTLTAGEDFGNLNLGAYLPLPVFQTTDPTGDGTNALFTTGDGLTAGTYKLTTSIGGVSIQGVSTNGTANDVFFNLGSNNDPSNTTGQTIKIDFAVTAENKPFADGLFLTTQGNSQNFDAHAATTAITANAIQQLQLLQPELVTKTGVVSVVGNTGSTTKGTYSPDASNSSATWTSQSGNPNTQFAPAGTPVGNPFGTGNPLSSDDMNVTGVDGGDLARIVSTVENDGHATAFDVTVNGTLPSGYTASNVTNFAVYDSSGNQLAYSGSTANYFSSTGITLTNGVAAGQSVYVVYDLRVSTSQAVGETLTAASSVVNWANHAGGVAAGEGFVTSGTPVGEIAADLADNATIGILAPSIAKTVIAGNDTASGEPVALPTVVLGETITYQLVLTVPEGAVTNNGADVTFTDVLPAGTTFVGTPTITYDGNIVLTGGPASGGAITVDQNGQTLTFHLGTAITNSLADATDTITVTYQVKVNTTNTPANGATFTNAASLQYGGTAIAGTSATVTELNPNVTETIGVKDHATGGAVTNIYSGEVLDYTVSLANASGAAPANNLTFYVEVPTTADLTGLTSLVAQNGGTITDNGAGGSGEVLKITLPGLAAGATANFTFEATVRNNLAAGTSIVVDTPTGTALSGGPAANGSYNSLPTAVDTGHSYSSSASNTETVAQLTANLGIIGEANNTSGGGTGLYGTAVSSVNATVGDIIRYSATVQLPEGQQSDLQVTVNLPPGMIFQNDSSITVEFVSPNGSITTVDFGSAASVTGGTSFNPFTAKATFNLPASQIVVNPDGTVTFNLGQINDNEGSALPDFAIVQFNAIVANQASNVDHTTLAANAAVGPEASEGSPSANATVTAEEPHVTLTKGVTSIVTSGGVTTVTYTETLTNTGDATAYNVILDDPDAGTNVGTIANLTATGALTVTSGNGTHDLHATGSLAAGGTETFTYTETVTTPSNGVADTTATVTYASLSNATTGGETLAGSATGASGSATGSRDGTTTPASLNNYNAQVTLGLGVVEGNVWNDVGSPLNTAHQALGSTADSELAGVTVSGAWTGGSSSVTTDGSGNFFILLPDMPGLNQKVSTPTSIGSETLVYDTTNSATFHHTETGLSAANSTLNVTPNASTPVTGYNFAYRLPDTAPTLSTWGNTSPTGTVVTDVIGGPAVVLGTGGAGVSDSEIDALVGAGAGNYNGTVLTVNRNGGANANDVFGGAGTSGSGLFFTGTAVDYNGTQIGTFTQSGGTLTITFNSVSGATSTDVRNVLNNLTYANTGSANQLTSGILLNATLSDHNTETGTVAGNAFQGTGGVKTSTAVQVLVDLAPTPATAGFIEPNNTAASGAAVTLAPNVVLTDAANLSQAVLTITTNHQAGEDVLTFTPNAGTFGDIQGTFVSATGILTLTSAGGATVAQWQAALRSVQYYDGTDMPHTGTRTITIQTTDRTGGGTISATLATVTVTPTNDSPVLTLVSHDSFPTATETATATPPSSGTVGTLVSSLIAGSNITDTDANGQYPGDGTASLPTGIAITQADTSAGTWWYSTDNGAHWTEFAGTGTTGTALNGSNALHLNSTAMVYFAPAAGANGAVDTALTFRAWDQFDTTLNAGVVNGAVTNLPTDGISGALGTGINTQASAYSANQQVLSLAITGSQTVTYTEPNGPNLPGSAIAADAGLVLTTTDAINSATVALSGGHPEDTLTFTNDGLTMGNITGSYANGVLTLSSIGHSATAAQFQAAIDAVKFYDTSDTPITGNRTVTVAVVDGTQGPRTIASTTAAVIAGNDSPILNGHAVTLTPGTENQLSAPTSGTVGTQISALIGGGNLTDTDGANSSHGQPLGALGIAVTAADTSEGNWWFSLDGGHTWTEFAGTGTTGTALNGLNALHLASNVVGGVDQTQIYFQPTVTNANGVIANALTFRGWDQFDTIADPTVVSGAVTTLPTDSAFGTGTNTQASAYSSATQTLPIVITATGGATYTEVNGPDTGTAAVIVDPTAVLTATTDTFTSATVSITNFQPEDHLVFTNNGSTMGNVTGSYNSSTGTLTLTSAGGVSAAQMQAALDAVTYYDSSDTPVTTTRNVTISAHDSTAGSDVAVATTTVTVVATNDSPILTPVPHDSIATGTENSGTAPVNGTTVGTLVSSLIGGHVTDPDGANAHDGATPGLLGIAITQADTTAGTWWYSTDNGAHWTEFAGTGTTGTALNGANALHLVADANTMIYFAPAAGANGAVDTALTYRAWDQYFNPTTGSVSANGLVSTLPTDSSFGTGTNTNASAYSASQQVLSLAITGSQTVAYIEPNGPNLPSSAIAADAGLVLTTSDAITSATVTLSGGHAEDTLVFTNDGLTMGNITGSYANGVLTLSSAGNTATAAQFQAAIDAVGFYDKSDTPITGNRTVTVAVVDGTQGARTIASTTVTVTPTNDSPVLTPVSHDSFPTATETATATPPSSGTVGTLVSSLIAGSNITDTDANGQYPGDSTASLPTGIAITQADTSAGTWWYSTDNGAHWTEFAGTGTTGTALNGSNALHLNATAMVYFAPAAGANGAVDTALTFRAWDQFDTTLNAGVVNGAVTNLPTDGISGALGTGINTQASAYSANQQVLSLAITGNQTVTYTEPNGPNLPGSAIAADAGLVLTTTDAITSATVTLSGGHAEDTLVFANDGLTMGNITGSYANGVLTLSSIGHSATAAQFQAAIDAVKFYDTSDTPITGNRTVTVAVVDGTQGPRTIASTTVAVHAANDSPVLTPNPSLTVATATENGPVPTGAVGTLVSSLIGGVTDPDGANAHDGATPGLLGIAITQTDTTEGTWYYTTDNGAHWTAFAGTGLPAISGTNALHLVADANTRIFFQSTAGSQSSTVDTALTFRGWDQFDGAANGSLAALPTDSAFGTGINTLASAYSAAVQTVPLTIAAGGAVTFNEPNDTPASAVAVAVNSGLILTSGDTFTGATVQITGNFKPGEDVLKAASLGVFTPGTYDSTTGTLSFTGTGTAAQLQAALQAVMFYDSSDTPITAATRTITITGHDATTNTDRTLSISTATVTASNDSPVLHGTSVSLTHATEDGGAPVGAVGTLVSALTGNGNVTDTDGANAHDGATPGLTGIAITQADTTEGTWYYTTDNGTHWTAFAGTGLPTISATNALHLVADGNTRIYFQPTADWNGAIPAALTIRGWDQFDGAANGSLSALPTDGTLGAGINTRSSAYSSATQTLQLVGDPVNDAPIATGSSVLLATTEDTSNPPGDTVAHLFGGNFSDTADQQQTAANPTGSVANTLAGVAITGNAATAGQGVWQYSTDNGAHWTSIATTGLSDTSAIVLPQSAELRFVPVADFNGVPGGLTTRLIDSSTETVTTGVTGLSLASDTTAHLGVDVSGVHDGGSTAVSAATVALSTSVTAVNDAPIASGSATLASPLEDGNPAGTSIASLLGQTTINYSDAADTVTTAVSGGSVGTPSAGIAITGNAATAAQGTYQYSTDNGTTWISIPVSGLSDSNALVIPNSAELRFVPTADYNGAVGSLTAHVSDGTNLPTTGTHDISATEGGTGGFSAGTITIGTSVTAVNDAPIASGSASLPAVSQDARSIPGETVSQLFGGNFSDTADQQRTTANPTGSVANTLAGIAITGNAAAGQGTYEYSADGVTWIAVPTNVSDSNAIIVPVTGSIRFVPIQTFHGTPGGLTVHLIDNSSGALTQISTGVDASHVGGSTAISLAPVVLTTSVTEGGGNAILSTTSVFAAVTDTTTSSSTTAVDKPPTDDLGTAPVANHETTTDDFLQRPIIPQVWLIGSVGNRFVIAEQQAIIAIPSNLFEDSYPGAQLEFDARNPAGGALPSWLQFDARNLTFTGTPPASAHGAVDVLIVAKDQFGNEATASFRILVGRETQDLQHLVEPNSPPPEDVGQTTASKGNQPTPPNEAAPGRRPHTASVPHDRHADLGHAHGGTVDGLFASLAQPANGVRHGHSAFSAQLREAGPIGRLSQARQLLDTIAKTVTSKPTA